MVMKEDANTKARETQVSRERERERRYIFIYILLAISLATVVLSYTKAFALYLMCHMHTAVGCFVLYQGTGARANVCECVYVQVNSL